MKKKFNYFSNFLSIVYKITYQILSETNNAEMKTKKSLVHQFSGLKVNFLVWKLKHEKE